MLDGWARRLIDPALDRAARSLAAAGISANAVTLAACAIGLAAAAAISLQWYLAGLVLMLLSRIGDGLDGAVAKIAGKTDLGGYLDIVLDFLFYGVIPVGFVLADPAANAVAGAVLVFSFYVNGASFLAFAAIAAKRNMASRGARPEIAVLHHRPRRSHRDDRRVRRLLPGAAMVSRTCLRLRGADLLHRAVARSCLPRGRSA